MSHFVFPAEKSFPQNLRTDNAVGNAVAPIGHGEQDSRIALRMRPEPRQSIHGFCKRAAPGKADFEGKAREQFAHSLQQLSAFCRNLQIALQGIVNRIVLAADDQSPVIGDAPIDVWTRGFPPDAAIESTRERIEWFAHEGVAAAIARHGFRQKSLRLVPRGYDDMSSPNERSMLGLQFDM